jgi:hypothetical protein
VILTVVLARFIHEKAVAKAHILRILWHTQELDSIL